MGDFAPFVHGGASTRRLMLDVSLALTPAVFGAFTAGGWGAVRTALSAVAACTGTEALLTLFGRANFRDGSALVSGLLLTLLLPADCPWWAAPLGGIAAMLAKALSGGLGRNLWNPAAFGRTVLLAVPSLRAAPLRTASGPFLLGYTGGSMGEVSSLLLLSGAAYLLFRRLLPWRIAAPALVAAFLTGLCLPGCDALAVLVWGGTLLTACFLAADPVTSPMGQVFQALYGTACGVICTVCAYYACGIAASCAALLVLNLLFRAAEAAAFRCKSS